MSHSNQESTDEHKESVLEPQPVETGQVEIKAELQPAQQVAEPKLNRDFDTYLDQIEKINQDLMPVIDKQNKVMVEKTPHFHDPNFGDQSQMMDIIRMYLTALTSYAGVVKHVMTDDALPKTDRKELIELIIKKAIDVARSYKELKEAYIYQSKSIISHLDIHLLATVTCQLTDKSLLELMDEYENENKKPILFQKREQPPQTQNKCCVIL